MPLNQIYYRLILVMRICGENLMERDITTMEMALFARGGKLSMDIGISLIEVLVS